MSLRTCLWTLVCGTALGATGSASALTVVNETTNTLTLSSPVSGAARTAEPGAQLPLPNSWGDARHVYLSATTATGVAVCEAMQDRYGTIKLPSHWVGVAVRAGGACEPLAQLPANPTPPLVEPDPPAPDEPRCPGHRKRLGRIRRRRHESPERSHTGPESQFSRRAATAPGSTTPPFPKAPTENPT